METVESGFSSLFALVSSNDLFIHVSDAGIVIVVIPMLRFAHGAHSHHRLVPST